MDQNLSRAKLLMEQKRYNEAIPFLKQAITADPDDSGSLILLSFCYLNTGERKKALESAKSAVSLSPDYFYAHYALAHAHLSFEKIDDAMRSIEESLRLYPEFSNSYYTLGELYSYKRNWEKALEAADKGLEYDAESTLCLQLKTKALNGLNRHEEAEKIIQHSLSIDPEDSGNLEQSGWQKIEKGEYEKALVFFKEALKSDPLSDGAKEGITEVLKAKSFIFRPLLRYHLFISKLGGKAIWGFIIGAYIIMKVLKSVAKINPELQTYIMPVLIVYVIFVFYSWFGDHFFNLLLRLHPIGKHILNEYQRNGSNIMGLMLLSALISGTVGHFTGIMFFARMAILLALLSLPYAKTLSCEIERIRKKFKIYSYALSGIALFALMADFKYENLSMMFFGLFIAGFIIFFWIYNYLAIKEHS